MERDTNTNRDREEPVGREKMKFRKDGERKWESMSRIAGEKVFPLFLPPSGFQYLIKILIADSWLEYGFIGDALVIGADLLDVMDGF